MTRKIAEILESFGIENYGFCDYSLLKNELLECRSKSRIPASTKTVIVCLFPYKVCEKSPNKISRYSAVGDYHEICGGMLKKSTEKLKYIFKENEFEFFIDNSPIKEVKAAAYAGLGRVGNNNLLITKKYGSFVFIGEILTDLKIQTVNNNITECIKCGLCQRVCPTGFLNDNKNKCLSAITQQKKDLSEAEQQLIKNNCTVWGCDICQNVCPMNQKAEKTNIKEFIKTYRDGYEKGENITGRAFEWRGEKVITRNYDILNKKK